ncbi:hypothetical protein ABIF66_004664 [Bradyrhizobium japonicum]
MLRFELNDVSLADIYSQLQDEMALIFKLPLADKPGEYLEIRTGLKIVRDSALKRYAAIVLRFEELAGKMCASLASDIAQRTGWQSQRDTTGGSAEFVFKTSRGVTQVRRKEGTYLSKQQRYAIVAAELNSTARNIKSVIADGRRVGGAWVSIDERTARRLNLHPKSK